MTSYLLVNAKKLLSVLLLPALLNACSKPAPAQTPIAGNPADTSVSMPAGNDRTYLALGDSYTIGQSVDSADRYPAQTTDLLRRKNIQFQSVQFIAATGWTTLNLQSAIAAEKPKGPYAAVSLLIGVNDQYQTGDTTNYRGHFTQLLETAIYLAGNNKQHVFVLSIPDYGVTPFGANYPAAGMQIDEFNAINESVTLQYGIAYINVTGISRDDAGDASMLAYDGLHPSGRQYAQWAAVLEPVMEKGLQ